MPNMPSCHTNPSPIGPYRVLSTKCYNQSLIQWQNTQFPRRLRLEWVVCTSFGARNPVSHAPSTPTFQLSYRRQKNFVSIRVILYNLKFGLPVLGVCEKWLRCLGSWSGAPSSLLGKAINFQGTDLLPMYHHFTSGCSIVYLLFTYIRFNLIQPSQAAQDQVGSTNCCSKTG